MLAPTFARRPLALLLLTLWGASAPAARGAFVSEGAFDAAVRSTTNANAPGPGGPSYSLARGGELQVGADGRGTGFAVDSGLKFALGSVAMLGQAITSATLTLNVALVQGAAGLPVIEVDLTAFGTTNANLTLADFAGPQVSAGSTVVVGRVNSMGNLAGTDAGVPLAPVTFDVTAVLNSLLTSGATSVGFVLASSSSNALFFSSSNASDPSLRPALTFNTGAVPAPPAAVLVLAGLLGIGPLARLSARSRS